MKKTTVGIIGLGRMGLNMAERLRDEGHEVVGFNLDETPRAAAEAAGVTFVTEYSELIAALPTENRFVWVMVTSSAVDAVLGELTPFLSPGDTVVDGGNSFYQDSIRRHGEMTAKELQYLDAGTSGGMEGARQGASIMVGGDAAVFEQHEAIFSALAAPNGYARVGAAGAGHFVKMVHNGIEYGMMGAIAEGMNVLKEHETQFDLNLDEVLKPYEHESIITSKLVSWLREAYEEGQIDAIKGEVPKGETEAEMEHILTIADTKVLAAALAQRKATRETPSYIGKLIAAMRNQFGGHKTITKE